MGDGRYVEVGQVEVESGGEKERDEYDGEQPPGSSFMLETGSFPCKYIVCTCVVSIIL